MARLWCTLEERWMSGESPEDDATSSTLCSLAFCCFRFPHHTGRSINHQSHITIFEHVWFPHWYSWWSFCCVVVSTFRLFNDKLGRVSILSSYVFCFCPPLLVLTKSLKSQSCCFSLRGICYLQWLICCHYVFKPFSFLAGLRICHCDFKNHSSDQELWINKFDVILKGFFLA